jgi:hypothetical protein
MAKFRRSQKNPIGKAMTFIGDRKKPIEIINREIFETNDAKVIKIMKKDPELEEIKEVKQEQKENQN